jgi:TRAP-type mannitol/chloroaromatic compound transport system permease large subunit
MLSSDLVVTIMLGFPTAFTLMGMGMIFTWLAYERGHHQNAGPDGAGGVQDHVQRRCLTIPLVGLSGSNAPA